MVSLACGTHTAFGLGPLLRTLKSNGFVSCRVVLNFTYGYVDFTCRFVLNFYGVFYCLVQDQPFAIFEAGANASSAVASACSTRVSLLGRVISTWS